MRSEAFEKALAPYAAFEDDRRFRAGFTTGATAATATLAMAILLFSEERLEAVSIRMPVGAILPIPIESLELVTEDGVISTVAAVRKGAGDDPDATDGLLLYVRVDMEESAGTESSEKTEIPVACRAETGIGAVTKPGLDQSIGEAAINHMPRNMIAAAVRSAYQEGSFKSLSDTTRIMMTLSCPEGEEKAKKTFNPKLGTQDRLSILGTEGIVWPMSRRAPIKTIMTNVKFRLAARPYFPAMPGSYGLHFLERHFGVGATNPVVMSNFIDETLDAVVQYGAKGVLFTGHIGKSMKLAGDIMDTHSRETNCRLEPSTIHTFRVGAPKELVTTVLQAGLTAEAVRLLKGSGFLGATLENLLAVVERAVAVRTHRETKVDILFYTLEDGVLAKSENARRLMEGSTKI